MRSCFRLFLLMLLHRPQTPAVVSLSCLLFSANLHRAGSEDVCTRYDCSSLQTYIKLPSEDVCTRCHCSSLQTYIELEAKMTLYSL